MCYKEEVQKRNAEKLQRKFEEENVPEFICDFFPRIASRSARLNYWSTIKNMLIWLMENDYIKRDKISEIITEDIKNIRTAKMISYFEHLKYEKKISLSTLNTQKNQLGSFWEYLKEEHYLDDNIVHMVKSEEFKQAKTNRRKMEKMPLYEDIQEMIEKILSKPDEFVRIRNIIVFRVLRGTGLRESELAGLDIDNVFLEEEHPYILVISKGTYDYTDKGKDIVYLTKDATAALSEWFEYRNKIDNIIDTKAVFLNKNGKRMNEDNIQSMFKNYSNGKLTPHMMRHEYTTVLQRETNDPTFVQEQGRWKSDKVMKSVYDSGASRSLDKLANM
ncbi:hypothetical protein DS742_14260 [Lacrimispora amygdalina]|uniref:Tyr recombinase domain-containing protein n=1 Tax=Lacrimispora amygdalina TaxID=253257 RepID=A0A3E2NBA5_9FIRM|nr:tyrosine-type recombinase/integrase [Clostridium indicum]RFZ78273.1 hypothetical protein DS742_14260 [Clostridium indicum]